MPKVTFIQPSGESRTVDALPGQSVMRAALDNGVRGIVAECGGGLSCATCHGYVADDWIDRLPAPSIDEEMMIDIAVDVRPGSRLTCQIVMTEALDGLVVALPKSQYG